MEEIKNEILNNTAEAEEDKIAAVEESAVQVGESAAAAVAPAKNDNKGEFISDNVRIVSPLKLVLKRFFRSRLSIIGLVMFLAVVVFSFLGPVFVGWGEDEPDYSPAQRTTINYSSDIAIGGDGVEYTYYTVSVSRPTDFNPHAEAFTYGINENGKKALHVLGTDASGYDIFVRLMYGGRLSLMLSFLVVVVYTVIGIIMGGLAGYFGGWVDMIIMRLVDILNCLPSLPIMLIIGAFFDGSGMDEGIRVYFMMGVLTLMSWPGTTRLVRGQILSLREQEYMIATDALGFSPWRKIFKHLVPNVMPQLIVSMTLGLGGTILTEASLSFLNLGAPSTVASLGRMVNAAKAPSVLANYPLDWLPAGLIIIIAVVAFNFIGDGLRDALDPKMKR
ncbi:MAG: ABC transporter permease [Clostridiales bacterium]|nr:ABC transporter permease [Clostridiales bacterium]